MNSISDTYGNIRTQYSEEGARIARHSIDAANAERDSYEKNNLFEKGLEDIRKAPNTTLDEKVIAQFGIDAISCLRDSEDHLDKFCTIRRIALSAIGAAMPGSIGSVLTGITGEAALLSDTQEVRDSLETVAGNNIAFHRGLKILSQHKTNTSEDMAIKEMGAKIIRQLSEDEGPKTTGKNCRETGSPAVKDNGELTERAATILNKALTSPIKGSVGMTIASTVIDIVTDDLSIYSKNCVLGYGISAIQLNPQSTPVEKALARFSSNTTVHMLDADYSALVDASVLRTIAAQPSDIEHRALAAATMSAAKQYTSWGDRDRRDVLYEGLRNIVENKTAWKDVKKLAQDAMKSDDTTRDHTEAVTAMMNALKEIEMIPSTKEIAEVEIREMAGNLERDSSALIEIEDEFIDIDGIRLRRNTL